MALENKLDLASSADLAREEERISKKKAAATDGNQAAVQMIYYGTSDIPDDMEENPMQHIYIASCVQDGGIYHYILNKDGNLTFQEKTELAYPMYLKIREQNLYVIVRDADPDTKFGGFISFDIGENGELCNPSDMISTLGIEPCHLEVTEAGNYVVNYGSGNIVKLPDLIRQHDGHGIDPQRQEAPHTHCVIQSPDQKYVLCADLGLDQIILYDHKLQEQNKVAVPPGSGVRHLCFSENGSYLYAVTELSNEVCVFDYNDGNPILIEIHSGIPGYQKESYAAAIRIQGEYLYISNRGADTISRFRMEEDRLVLLEQTDCGGNFPRDFAIFEEYLVCTNERSGTVSVMRLEEGKPVLTDIHLEISTPLCVTGILL